MSASIIDVATLAGVSKSTVSAVINGHSNVRPNTRRRVLDAIKQLDYHPNLAARELITANKTNIGIVLPSYENVPDALGEQYFPFINEASNYDIVSRLSEQISRTDFGLLTEHVVISAQEPSLPAFVLFGRVAGVFQISPLFDDRFIQQLRERVDAVVEIGIWNPQCEGVYSDFVDTCSSSVIYLLRHGHRRIAFINGDPASRTACDRLQGYRLGLASAGITYDSSIARAVPFTGLDGYRAFRDIWAQEGEKPTAVICSTEVVAGGVMRYAHENSLRVPEDVSVISNEDGNLCEFLNPTITTISRDKELIATNAFKIMMDRLRDPDRPMQHIKTPNVLVERKSVKTR